MENFRVDELRAELGQLLKKQAEVLESHEALARQRTPSSSNTRSGKKLSTKYAINSRTPFRGSGLGG